MTEAIPSPVRPEITTLLFGQFAMTGLLVVIVLMLLYIIVSRKKVNGSGEKPPEFWIMTIDGIVKGRLVPLKDEIQELKKIVERLVQS